MSQESGDPRFEKFHSLLKQSRDMLEEASALVADLDVEERSKALKRIGKAISQTIKTEKLIAGRGSVNADELPVRDEGDRSEPPA